VLCTILELEPAYLIGTKLVSVRDHRLIYDLSTVAVIEPNRFPARFNLELFRTLQDTEAQIFTPKVVYDGKKNVFSPRELPIGEGRKVILLSKNL